jgi:hypothetical protein
MTRTDILLTATVAELETRRAQDPYALSAAAAAEF